MPLMMKHAQKSLAVIPLSPVAEDLAPIAPWEICNVFSHALGVK